MDTSNNQQFLFVSMVFEFSPQKFLQIKLETKINISTRFYEDPLELRLALELSIE